MKKACIAIGVNRTDGMPPLAGAAEGAQRFAEWAQQEQGYDTVVLTDDHGRTVTIQDVLKEISRVVEDGTYHLLVLYFAGHGVLLSPGGECWLLTHAPANPNESVNVLLSIERGRNSRIPHLVVVSDACRSDASGPQLRGLTPGVVFKTLPIQPQRSEVDVFYATLPGDPALEVSSQEAVSHFEGIFTKHLLKGLRAEVPGVAERLQQGTDTPTVVASRPLKPYLESSVSQAVASKYPSHRQVPEVRVESALPKYLSIITRPVRVRPPDTQGYPFAQGLASDAYMLTPEQEQEADSLREKSGRLHFETQTGFTVYGARIQRVMAPGCTATAFTEQGCWHVRLSKENDLTFAQAHGTILIVLDSGMGVVAAVIPEFIGTIVVKSETVVSINYVPSENSFRYQEYVRRRESLERLKARAAVLSRSGRFGVPSGEADAVAGLLRMEKAVDPSMGVYAAYAYYQGGQLGEVLSVFRYVLEDTIMPIPFDVAALASLDHRYSAHQLGLLIPGGTSRIAPLCPMLSQGWMLLDKDSALYQRIHDRLRPHMQQSLWTVLRPQGVAILEDHMRQILHQTP